MVAVHPVRHGGCADAMRLLPKDKALIRGRNLRVLAVPPSRRPPQDERKTATLYKWPSFGFNTGSPRGGRTVGLILVVGMLLLILGCVAVRPRTPQVLYGTAGTLALMI